jgi:hypothetical protein
VRHNHGKNIIGTIRIQLCAKSFILQMYDVLARHKGIADGKKIDGRQLRRIRDSGWRCLFT